MAKSPSMPAKSASTKKVVTKRAVVASTKKSPVVTPATASVAPAKAARSPEKVASRPLPFKAGGKVAHPLFGHGVIKSVEPGKLLIDFANAGTKWIVTSFVTQL